ncbi:hypothetical protein COCOBI_18-0600 [Coccomyxa sp. Obi]|nr:hypothetical protein COCOBI_18-0600 [Coccomyxa sp. Obi]
MLETPSSSNTTPEDQLPSPGRGSVSEQTSFSERDSDADLAERHAAAVASATARPMGLVERMDSANYQPRPPAMTERQDSAQNLQAMAEEMAELTAGGAAEAAGAPQPLGRQDSAHDMADADISAASPPGRGPSITGVSRQELPDSPFLARLAEGAPFRRDSASEQLRVAMDSAGPSTSAEALMPRAPSLHAARALMRDTPVGSPQDARIGVCPPELEVAPRQDSALDSLVAARHAVLADLAADVAGARPSGSVDAGTPMAHQTSYPLFEAGDSRGNASDVPALDPLVQARALVHPELASSSSWPVPRDGEAMEGVMAGSSLEAARMAVLGRRPWSASRTWSGARLGDDATPASGMMPTFSSLGLPLEGQRRSGKEALRSGSLSADHSLQTGEGMQTFYSIDGGSLDAGPSDRPASSREAALGQQLRQRVHLPFLNIGVHGGPTGSSPFEQAAEGGDHGQDSPMHTLEQARRTVTAFTDQDGLTDGGAPAFPPVARRQPSAALPDSPMMAGPAGGASAAAFAPEWQRPQAGEAGPSGAAQPGRPMSSPLGSGYDSANELTRSSQ